MRSLSMALLLSLVAGCATGGGRTTDSGVGDAGAGMDAGLVDGDGDADPDAAVPPDASMTPDAAVVPDARVDPDGGAPIDGGGATACTAANASTVCGGRACVDGYCCDLPCDETCERCDGAGVEGTCTLYEAGVDPEDECAETTGASCGTTGSCDGEGACAFHEAALTCDDGLACTTGDACDGAGTCRGGAPPDCAPAAGNECCLGSCDSSGGCTTDEGSCADVCGGAELAVGRACMGCGAARAAGSCLGGSIHRCDEASHSPCEQVSCGGTTYFCTSSGGSWAWRTTASCDDGDACTFGDVCNAGSCGGGAISCLSDVCVTRTCNGGATCTETPNSGVGCDDGDPCSYGDTCSGSGTCAPSGTVTCTTTTCLARSCNGTASCTETPLTGACDDGVACTNGETCGGGTCGGGAPVTCPPDTTCATYACNGTSTCNLTPLNEGMACDDGDSGTPVDRCESGTCVGLTCSPTLEVAFSDNFSAPSSAAWTAGTDVALPSSPWSVFTNERHGVRISGGRMEITNERSGSADHGHGYAYVRAGGVGADYDTSRYDSALSSNDGHEVVWTLNMRRSNPSADSTSGGFSCSSSSNQNGRMVGLAYMLAGSSATGLQSTTGSCGPTGSAVGYAVVMGGDSRVRLVRFANGLRNGALTDLVASSSLGTANYFSVRVTYNADTNQWRLEARSDGSASFADPATGSYSSSGTATDATYVAQPLDFSGPYFQTGCCCLCDSEFVARFDNVTVGRRCAP